MEKRGKVKLGILLVVVALVMAFFVIAPGHNQHVQGVQGGLAQGLNNPNTPLVDDSLIVDNDDLLELPVTNDNVIEEPINDGWQTGPLGTPDECTDEYDFKNIAERLDNGESLQDILGETTLAEVIAQADFTCSDPIEGISFRR